VRIGSFNPNDPLYDGLTLIALLFDEAVYTRWADRQRGDAHYTGLLTGPIQETASISTQGEVAPRRVELSPQTAQPPIKRSNRSPWGDEG